LNLFKKESENLANRLIEGQVLNAQYAEESYQLKRENSTLKKQIEDINQLNNITIERKNSNLSDFIITSNNNELEILNETVNRLSAVCFFLLILYNKSF
jgi:cyclophilin family peptidyl-prolyl cis-trans isomerase